MNDYSASVKSADSYNGACCDKYTWSQSISDLEVIIHIPDSLRSHRDLKIDVSTRRIKVEVRKSVFEAGASPDEWSVIFEGELNFDIKKHEAIWTLEPFKHLHIHLEKSTERWWEALLVDEPKLELSKIDCTREMDELSQEEQMKLEELIFNHKQKLLKQTKDPSAVVNN